MSNTNGQKRIEQLRIQNGVNLDDQTWRDYANCIDMGFEMFVVERGMNTRPAKMICKECVVLEPCLEYGVFDPERYSVIAGTAPETRRRIRNLLDKEEIPWTDLVDAVIRAKDDGFVDAHQAKKLGGKSIEQHLDVVEQAYSDDSDEARKSA